MADDITWGIQVLRSEPEGWIPATVDEASYHPGEHWYTERVEAFRDLIWLKRRLTHVESRMVHRDSAGTVTYEPTIFDVSGERRG